MARVGGCRFGYPAALSDTFLATRSMDEEAPTLHSQIRSTDQPARRNCLATRRSRFLLSLTLASQKLRFVRGLR
jgi:hypothetical protein